MRLKTLFPAFLVLYFLLLVWNASFSPLEWDEGTSLLVSAFVSDFSKWWIQNPTLSPDKIVSFALDFNLHYKGAYLFFYFPLLLRFAVFPFLAIFPPTLLAFRFVAIISSLLCLLGVFFLGRKLGLSDESSVFASALLAVTPIFFNQSYHIYNHIFAAAIIIWAAYAYLSRRHGIFLILSILAFHARYATGLIWLAVFADVFFHEKQRLSATAKQFFIYLALTVPWFFAMQFQPFFPNLLTARYVDQILFQPSSISQYLGYAVLLPLYSFAPVVAFAFLSLKKPSRPVLFLLVFAASTLAFYSLAVPSYSSAEFAFHYMLSAIVFIPLLAQVGLSNFKRERLNPLLLACSVIYLLFVLPPASPISPDSLGWGGTAKADLGQIAWASANSEGSGIIISNQAQTMTFRLLGEKPYLFQYPYGRDLDKFIGGEWKDAYSGRQVPDIRFSLLLWDDWLDGRAEPPREQPVFSDGPYKAYLLGLNPK